MEHLAPTLLTLGAIALIVTLARGLTAVRRRNLKS